jgi:hypothetical protein
LPDDPATRRDQAAAAIERYLAEHPSAADSVRGIAQWWLPALGVDLPAATVAEALEWLLQQGRIACDRPAGGEPIFRAAGTGHPLT